MTTATGVASITSVGRRYFESQEEYEDWRLDQFIRRGCTCNVGFAWENGPCDYCNGDYRCPDGCGEIASECRCDERCAECGDFECEGCEEEEVSKI